MIYILGGVVLFSIFCYALISVPKSEEERRLEDEEQMRYLAEYTKKKK